MTGHSLLQALVVGVRIKAAYGVYADCTLRAKLYSPLEATASFIIEKPILNYYYIGSFIILGRYMYMYPNGAKFRTPQEAFISLTTCCKFKKAARCFIYVCTHNRGAYNP